MDALYDGIMQVKTKPQAATFHLIIRWYLDVEDLLLQRHLQVSILYPLLFVQDNLPFLFRVVRWKICTLRGVTRLLVDITPKVPS
jgi:hypothetical protein